MSYCRWSSDGFMSDVYVYENISGYWTIHIARNKIEDFSNRPENPYTMEAINSPNWREMYMVFNEWIDNAERVPIGLSYDGETIQCESPGGCAAALAILKETGYYVPDGVIETLWDEEKQRNTIAQEQIMAVYEAEARSLLNRIINNPPK